MYKSCTVLVFITVLFVIYLLYHRYNLSIIQSGSGKCTQLPHSPFINFNITSKPLGFEHSVCSNVHIKKKYPNNGNNFTNFDNQKIPNSVINWDYHSYNNDYYRNPGLFCLNNPHFRLCPNHWL